MKGSSSMNLGVFNRVNLKDNTEAGGMYSEWASLSPLIQHQQAAEGGGHSVLDKFTGNIGREVVLGVVRQLASNLGLTQPAEPSPLTTDQEVLWCMEVVCYGLSLPLTEHDTIKDCVNVYCEWLSALLPTPKLCVPQPLLHDPNLYARKIIQHFHNLFVPRKGQGVDVINRQAVLCHRVLRTLQQLASDSEILNRETWDVLLLFLLAINDTLLSPPEVRDDVADQLCERVLSVLLDTWLVACARGFFPAPPLWRSLRQCCMQWRHRPPLVDQWNRVCLALTARLLRFTFGPRHAAPALLDLEELLPSGITDDCCAQAWYRLLHTIGNPAHLARPYLVSRTDKFLQLAVEQDQDPTEHPCLQHLPGIFLRAMRGIAAHVDAFLGTWGSSGAERAASVSDDSAPKVLTGTAEAPAAPQSQTTPTPPPHRRLAKSFSVAPTSSLSSSSTNTSLKGIQKASLIGVTSRAIGSTQSSSISSSGPPSSTSSITSTTSVGGWNGSSWGEMRGSLAAGRPKCNSILHLFGEWLFESAFIGTDLQGLKGATAEELSSSSSVNRGDYEGGRAEAIGALCRIFCAKKTGEEILPVYLARFYLAVRCALKQNPSNTGSPLPASLCSVLLNSGELFRVELDGVQTLVPFLVSALELVLPDKDLQVPTHISRTELRRASIHLLISLVALPIHFHNLQIRDLPGNRNDSLTPITFASLKPRLMNLVMSALQVETDAHNTHMLLGCLLACVQDSAALEQVDQSPSQQDSAENVTSNLLSSVSDTLSVSSSGGGIQLRSSGSERSSTPYEDIPSSLSSSAPLDSAHALFVRATYLVCHRLISTWKSDLNVSLGALELLSGLARIHIRESDALECKRAVKWTCDYIVSQCSRPPPAHSKDLHSTIVAAYQCLGTWLLEHPYLLHGPDSRDCLETVLETVELGVSGAKSGRARLKDDKEPKPASMRVRDAAECLLTQLLEHIGHFPGECGAESLSSLLDEQALIGQCTNGNANMARPTDRFRYFMLEGAAVLLALLEEPLGNDQDPQPTVTLILRGPFGRHAWTMQLRHLPRHRQGLTGAGSSSRCVLGGGPRPVAMRDAPLHTEHKNKYFPDSVERVPHCLIDECIPTTEQVAQLEAQDVEKLAKLIERQVLSEKNLCDSSGVEVPECSPPQVCHDYQTARLFLSHWGFLNNAGSLVALDTAALGTEFENDMRQLDTMCARTCDTVHIVYVRAGQNRVQEIIRNVLHESTVSPEFLDFLLTLGWPVLVSEHHGWTGHSSTSWKATKTDESNSDRDDTPPDHGGCLFDGRTQVLYWADAMSEVAFVIPSSLGDTYKKLEDSLSSEQPNSGTSNYNQFSHTSWYGPNNIQPAEKQRTMSLDLDRSSTTPNIGGSSGSTRRSGVRPQPQPDTRIVVAWLESYEDHLTFPVDDLVRDFTDSGLATNASGPRLPPCTVLIYLHLMQSGLVRVRVQHHGGNIGRGAQFATPLIDGAVVSRRALGPLVRQTAINVSRRRRLDSDSYQPPHVRRRLKLQDMLHKYKRDLTIPELLTYLFTTP